MIPSRRLVTLAFLPAMLSLAALVWPSVLVVVAVVDAALIVLAATDAWLGRLPLGVIEVTRAHAPVWSIGGPGEVRLTLRNLGARALEITVTDDAPGETAGLPASLRLSAGLEAEVVYTATVMRRGRHAFGPTAVRWRSPLGLWLGQRRLESPPDEVRVYPDFRHLREWGVNGRPDDVRLPRRAVRRPGGESEFERLRPYVAGDPYRHVDWKATARKQRLISREYGQEVNQNVVFLLDSGRLMTAPIGGLVAFDHALNAALAMGHVALRHGDRVGLMVYDDEPRAFLAPRGGARNGHRLIHATYDLHPRLREPDVGAAFRHLASQVRRRSLVVLLTTAHDQVTAAQITAVVRALAGRHLPLVVWLEDPALVAAADGGADDVEGWYTRAAASELVGRRAASLAEMRQAGALVVDVPVDRLTPALLARYLEIKARRLL